jgi:TetR/AcrR family transcriptional repressor of nem operon
MLTQGFAATSVEEICAAARLTKGSFFHYFKSKDDLGRVLLKRFCADGRQLHRSFCGGETDPLRRVYAYIDAAAKMASEPGQKGCLLGMFSQELCDLNPQIRAECEQGFDDWAKAFGEELARAKAKYAPRKSFHPRELADHLITVMEGGMILGKARKDMRMVARGLRHYKAYVKQLFES